MIECSAQECSAQEVDHRTRQSLKECAVTFKHPIATPPCFFLSLSYSSFSSCFSSTSLFLPFLTLSPSLSPSPMFRRDGERHRSWSVLSLQAHGSPKGLLRYEFPYRRPRGVGILVRVPVQAGHCSGRLQQYEWRGISDHNVI